MTKHLAAYILLDDIVQSHHLIIERDCHANISIRRFAYCKDRLDTAFIGNDIRL